MKRNIYFVAFFLVIGGGVLLAYFGQERDKNEIKNSTQNQVENNGVLPENHLENLKLIELEGFGINPEERSYKDYASLKFTLSVTDETRKQLNEIDTVVFYEQYGKRLGEVSKEFFSYDQNYLADLTTPVPLDVAQYIKDKTDVVIRFQLLSKGKLYAESGVRVSDGYLSTLVLNSPAPQFGTPTKIAFESLIVPKECRLMNFETHALLATFQRTYELSLLPKGISVYARCELKFGEIIETPAIKLPS